MTLLTVHDLQVRRGRRRVLRGLDFELRAGEVGLAHGPNGSGKTTLLLALSTQARIESGEVLIESTSPGPATRAKIGFLGHGHLLHPGMTVEANLRFFGRLYGVNNWEARGRELLDRIGLRKHWFDIVRQLSRGQAQRVGIVRALLHDPVLLLLDEPSSGLDQSGRSRLKTLVREHCAAGGAVLYTAHEKDKADIPFDLELELPS